MNMETQHHLDENAVLLAIVDEDRLSESKRLHLSACPQCLDRKKERERELARLGETAKEHAPLPRKRPTLPDAVRKKAFFNAVSWKPALAGSLVMVLVIAVSIWTMVPEKQPTVASVDNSIEWWEEELFMMEMDLSVENTLPGEYMEASSAYDVNFEEAFLDYIAPLAESQPLSLGRKMEGGPLC